ncbi:MAG TPA: peptidase, partial [Gammaproteobacteria bacterium]
PCLPENCGAGILDLQAAVSAASAANPDPPPSPAPNSGSGGGGGGSLWGLLVLAGLSGLSRLLHRQKQA